MEGPWILENADSSKTRECEDFMETQCGAYNPKEGLMAKATIVTHAHPNTLKARDFLNKYKELYTRKDLFDHKNIVKVRGGLEQSKHSLLVRTDRKWDIADHEP